uniref:Uncharacterized protein n=1 Tax=viral metagenome TaxID=1070528 RepID=A0A6C0J5X7_9ZZZZ
MEYDNSQATVRGTDTLLHNYFNSSGGTPITNSEGREI